MIKITLQRNDNKEESDKVSVEENRIFINEEAFEFPQGKDIQFIKPHEQIVNAYRDNEGILYATVIKQYTKCNCNQFECKDKNGSFAQPQLDIQSTRSIVEPVIVEIQKEEVKEQTLSELLKIKEDEAKVLKGQYLDADLDDNEELKSSLKQQIQELRKEITMLKENINNEQTPK